MVPAGATGYETISPGPVPDGVTFSEPDCALCLAPIESPRPPPPPGADLDAARLCAQCLGLPHAERLLLRDRAQERVTREHLAALARRKRTKPSS